jgi:hypothetical protein
MGCRLSSVKQLITRLGYFIVVSKTKTGDPRCVEEERRERDA